MRFDSKIFQRFISGQASDEEFEQVERYLSEQPDIALAEFDTCEDTLVSVLREGYENGQAPVDFENGELNDPSWEIVAQNLNRQFTLATRQLDISQYVDPPQSDEEVGRIGNYRLLKQIGSGGMGIVFEAKPVDSDHAVAIKLMNPLLAANPEAAYRFRRESLAAAKLTHDKIVKISEVDQASSIPFLVMELLRGESLAQRLRRDGRLSADRIIDYSIQVSEALEYAHARGILHRDIKPDNIWIDEHDRVKLLDFGLARTIDDQTGLTQTGAILGTPKYMSPEQAKGRNVDHRSDLFSLGSVMYEMLIGRPAFDRENFYSTILAVANDEVTDFESKRLETNTGLHRIVTRLLHKDPEKRIGTATALKKEMEALDPSEMLEPQAHVGRGGGNNWKSILLGFAAAALLFCFSIIIYVQTDRGTLVIDAGDDVEVSVVSETVKIRELGSDKEYTLKVGENRLPSGAYEIVVTDPATGLELSTTHFSLKRGGKELVNVGLKESKTGVAASDGDGGSLRGNPNAIGISPNAPARSIAEAFSKERVTETLAIIPGEGFNRQALLPSARPLGEVKNWAIETKEHRQTVTQLDFNFDGSLLASAGSDDVVRIWEYVGKTRRLKHIIPMTGRIRMLRWSPVENAIITVVREHVSTFESGEELVCLWRVGESVTLLDQLKQHVNQVAWSPSGTKVAMEKGDRGSSQIGLFNVSSGKFHGIPNGGMTGEFTERPWSHDEKLFAVATIESVGESQFKATLKIWDLESKVLYHQIPGVHKGVWAGHKRVLGYAYFSHSRAPNRFFEFLDFETMQAQAKYKFVNDRFVVGSATSNYLGLQIVDDQKSVPDSDPGKTIYIVDCSKVGTAEFQFKNLPQVKATNQRGDSDSLAISVDGKYALSRGMSISDSYEDENRELHRSIKWENLIRVCGSTGRVAVPYYVADADDNRFFELRVYKYGTGDLLVSEKTPMFKNASLISFEDIKFSNNGKKIAFLTRARPAGNESTETQSCKIIDLANGDVLANIEQESVRTDTVHWSPDDKHLVFDDNNAVRIVNVASVDIANTIELERIVAGRRRTGFSTQTTVFGVTNDSVFLHCHNDRIVVAPFDGDQTTTLLNNQTKLTFQDKTFSINEIETAAWNSATDSLAVAAEIVVREAKDESEKGTRHAVLVLKQSGNTATIDKLLFMRSPRSVFVSDELCFELKYNNDGKHLIAINRPPSANNRFSRTNGDNYVRSINLDSDESSFTRVTPVFKDVAPPEIIVRDDTIAYNFQGETHFKQLSSGNAETHSEQFEIHRLAFVHGNCVATDGTRVCVFVRPENKEPNATIPSGHVSYLLENSKPENNDLKDVLFGAAEIISLPEDADLNGMYLIELSADGTEFRTSPLSEAIQRFPQLVNDAIEPGFIEKVLGGSTKATKPVSGGINLDYPRRSITEVLSPDTVGKELAIEAGKAIGMYSQFVDPVKLPDIETWTIVSETRSYFSDMSFSMDGSLLAAGSSDNSVRIWEYEDQSRKLKHILPLNGQVKHVSWSPVQNVLLVSCVNGDAGKVSIWHVDDRLTIIDQVPILANSVAWSPGGTKVAIQSDQVEFFDVSLGRFSKLEHQQIKGEFSKKAWSQDERYFAVSQKNETSKLEGGARVNTFTWETFVYDLVEKRLHHSFQNARNAAWSSNSSRLAFEHTEQGAQKAERVEFWDMDEIEKISEHQLQNEEVVDWTSTTNSFAIVQFSWSKEQNQLESSKLKTLDFSNVDQKQNALAFDWSSGDINDSRRVNAVVGPNRHWACPSYFGINDHLHQYQTPSFWGIENYATMNKTGTRLVSFEQNYPNRDLYRIAVYESKNGKLIAQTEISIQPEKTARVSSMRVSDSGKYVYLVISLSSQSASGNRQTTFNTIMYDVNKNTTLFSFVDPPVLGDERYFTPDEKRLVDVGKTHVNVLDVQSGEVIHKFVREEPQTGSRRSSYSSRFLKSLIHLNNQRLLWFVAERGDWKIIECDLASAETKTVLSLGKMKEIAQSDRYSLDPIKLFWNEQSNCIVVAGRSTKLVPRESSPGRHSEKAYELLVISLEGEVPVIKHSLKIDGFNQARMQSVHSVSGDLFYYRTIETIDDRDLATEHVFIDLSDLNAKPRRFTVDMGDLKLNGFSKSGILFADQYRDTFKKVDVSGTVTSYKTKTRANLVYFASDIYIFQNGRHLSYFDQTGKHNHSVVLDNDHGVAQQHWHGKIGADRFGPWVKKAPGEYLVTISDAPEVGVITVPLDEARSKYPELFWEK